MDSPEIFALKHDTPVLIGRYRTQASIFKAPQSAAVSSNGETSTEAIFDASRAQVDSKLPSLGSVASSSSSRPCKQQALLNFGQKRLYSRTCDICGMVYQTGNHEDEATHAKQCRSTTGLPSVPIPAACKQLAGPDSQWSIFELLPRHAGSHSASVAAVLDCLQRDLGMYSVMLSDPRKLYVASTSRPGAATTTRPHNIVGAVLVEPVSQAQRAMPLAADDAPPAAAGCPPSPGDAAGARPSGALRVYGSARKRSRADAAPVVDSGNTSLVTDPSPPKASRTAASKPVQESALAAPPHAAEAKTAKTLFSFFKSAKPAAAASGDGGAQAQSRSPERSSTASADAAQAERPQPRAASVTGARGATFRVASATYPATLGVLQVWTHASHRRRGVATALVNVARTRAVFGQVVPKEQVAFSQPTSAGHAFASAFCERRDHLLYT